MNVIKWTDEWLDYIINKKVYEHVNNHIVVIRGWDPGFSSHRRSGTSLKTRVPEVGTLWFEFEKTTYRNIYCHRFNWRDVWAVFYNTVQVYIQ